MADKQRYQNLTVGDTAYLEIYAYNLNSKTNVSEIEKVEIYRLDPDLITADNPKGEQLVETITSIDDPETGKYRIAVYLDSPQYIIGNYEDRWHIKFESDDPTVVNAESFQIYPDQWFVTSLPVLYDFQFHFTPNRLVQGSKRYLAVDVMPNVPHASDLEKYYLNLVVAGVLKISISQRCGDCIPQEADLRVVADEETVSIRDGCRGFYFLDTTDLDTGIYDIWFTLVLGESTFISDKEVLEIHSN